MSTYTCVNIVNVWQKAFLDRTGRSDQFQNLTLLDVVGMIKDHLETHEASNEIDSDGSTHSHVKRQKTNHPSGTTGDLHRCYTRLDFPFATEEELEGIDDPEDPFFYPPKW